MQFVLIRIFEVGLNKETRSPEERMDIIKGLSDAAYRIRDT